MISAHEDIGGTTGLGRLSAGVATTIGASMDSGLDEEDLGSAAFVYWHYSFVRLL